MKLHHVNGAEQMFREQDAQHELYKSYGLVNGRPGSITEDTVRDVMRSIRESDRSGEQKWDALDALYWGAINNLEYGHISPVLEEISKAQYEVLHEPPQLPDGE